MKAITPRTVAAGKYGGLKDLAQNLKREEALHLMRAKKQAELSMLEAQWIYNNQKNHNKLAREGHL